MKGKRVGFVTYLTSSEVTASDTFLVSAIERLGGLVDSAPWDSPQVDWQKYDVLILRSCWNYHTKYFAFLKWLEHIETLGIHVWNPPAILRWNMDKSYLLSLNQKGIQIVPTSIITARRENSIENIFEEMESNKLVLKPAIGASAYEVHKINVEDGEKNLTILSSLLLHSDVLIQPFMEEIYDGEISLIFIGNTFTHAVMKTPKGNEFRVNHNGTAKLISVDQSIIEQGQHILNTIEKPILYARIDGLLVNKKFVLMELELIEPHLFIDLCPETADVFATEFAAHEQ